jgi:hypothetical protein
MTVLDPQDRFLTPLEEHDKIPYKVASSYCRDFSKRLSLSPAGDVIPGNASTLAWHVVWPSFSKLFVLCPCSFKGSPKPEVAQCDILKADNVPRINLVLRVDQLYALQVYENQLAFELAGVGPYHYAV